MSFEALRSAIYNRFNDNWSGTALSRVAWGDNRSPLNVNDGDWVRISYSVTRNQNAEIGRGFQRSEGIITVQIFVPAFSGERGANLLADEVATIFQNKQFNGVTCYTMTPIVVGRNGDAFQLNARVDFEYNIFS